VRARAHPPCVPLSSHTTHLVQAVQGLIFVAHDNLHACLEGCVVQARQGRRVDQDGQQLLVVVALAQ